MYHLMNGYQTFSTVLIIVFGLACSSVNITPSNTEVMIPNSQNPPLLNNENNENNLGLTCKYDVECDEEICLIDEDEADGHCLVTCSEDSDCPNEYSCFEDYNWGFICKEPLNCMEDNEIEQECEPTNPTNPTNPTDPTDPTDPTNPTEPTEPTDPTTPVCEPQAERCDGVDNDCDGLVDESIIKIHSLDYESLHGLNSGCHSRDVLFSGPCNAAIDLYCRDQDCGGSGFGPISNNQEAASFTCVSRDLYESQFVPYTTLAEQHPLCDGESSRMGRGCNSAIHRYCGREIDSTTGFGPTQQSLDSAGLKCVDQAQVITTSFEELSQQIVACDGVTETEGLRCNYAIHLHCISQGFISGWGPLEYNSEDVFIACIGG